jgi:tRNA-dihydrouridine synthase
LKIPFSGRAIFGNPWLWKEYEASPIEKLEVLVEHTRLFEELFLKELHCKCFSVMKKHYKGTIISIIFQQIIKMLLPKN